MRIPVDRPAFWSPLAAEVHREMVAWSFACLRGPLVAGDAEVAEVCRDHASAILDALARGCKWSCKVPWRLRRMGRKKCLLMGLALVVGISPGPATFSTALVKEMNS